MDPWLCVERRGTMNLVRHAPELQDRFHTTTKECSDYHLAAVYRHLCKQQVAYIAEYQMLTYNICVQWFQTESTSNLVAESVRQISNLYTCSSRSLTTQTGCLTSKQYAVSWCTVQYTNGINLYGVFFAYATHSSPKRAFKISSSLLTRYTSIVGSQSIHADHAAAKITPAVVSSPP